MTGKPCILQGMLTHLCSVLLFAAAQGQPQASGLDALAQNLAARTAERRAAAASAWQTDGDALLQAPEGALKQVLMSHAPEIQDPILESLRQELTAKPPSASRVRQHLDTLQLVVNASGADRLSLLLAKLPSGMERDLYSTLCKRGGPTSLRTLESRLTGDDVDKRSSALMALLRFGPMELCQKWVELAPVQGLERADRIDVLQALTDRSVPETFAMPEPWLELEHAREHDALFAYLVAHPEKRAEDVVLDQVLSSGNLLQLRTTGLAILEHGVTTFKWRDCKRKLGAILRDKDGDPLAVQTAWALHRMGEKSGKKFLLAGPEAEVRRNRANWRNHLELGELQVELGEFRDAFKSYKDGISIAEARRGHLRASDWLYASRAAAGARKTKEAGNWLARTRMSASELKPYRDLPEFADLLDKQPFKRLFGMP